MVSASHPNYRFVQMHLEDKAAIDALFAAEGFDAVGHTGLEFETLMAEIYGRTASGELVTGMEVFRQLYSAVGLGFGDGGWCSHRWRSSAHAEPMSISMPQSRPKALLIAPHSFHVRR